MNKKKRMLLKRCLLLFGLILLCIIAAEGIRKTAGNRQPQGEYMTLEDAAILLRELDAQIPKTKAYAALLEEEGEYLTYGAYRRLAESLTPEGEAQEFGGVYADGHFLRKDDWYAFFDEMRTLYDTQGLFGEKEITVLSVDAIMEERALSDGRILVAEQELYRYESSAFEKTLFQPLTAIAKGDTLLAIRRVNAQEYRLSNVWIVEVEDAKVICFWKNAQWELLLAGQPKTMREQVADIDFAGGIPCGMRTKTEKISGKLLAADGNTMEVEGAGILPVADNFKIYKLYGRLESCYTSDLRIGYDFTDFVIEDGSISACLIARDEAMETIRILISGSDYAGKMHETFTCSADGAYMLSYYDGSGFLVREEKAAGEEIVIDQNSQYVQHGRLSITPKALTGRIFLQSVQRSQGIPAYRGKIEALKTDKGLVLINELLLEEYLYAVVPSEMPASYPLEALKAQAVCARTYAYRAMFNAGFPEYGAHVDDSTSYQVYNNITEHAQTTKAVKETAGELLYVNGGPGGAYYYSTSCGYGTDAAIWKSGNTQDFSYLVPKKIGRLGETAKADAAALAKEDVFVSYITKKDDTDYESTAGWYRWTYTVDALEEAAFLKRIQERYAANEKLVCTKEGSAFISRPVEKLGKIKNITVKKRGPGGVIDELLIEGEKAVINVISEHNVRFVLNNGTAKVLRQDGSSVEMPALLPSAFFAIKTVKKDGVVTGYQLTGGGFGHGVGMSQNAAKAMAEDGMGSDGILQFFYVGSEIKNIYGDGV